GRRRRGLRCGAGRHLRAGVRVRVRAAGPVRGAGDVGPGRRGRVRRDVRRAVPQVPGQPAVGRQRGDHRPPYGAVLPDDRDLCRGRGRGGPRRPFAATTVGHLERRAGGARRVRGGRRCRRCRAAPGQRGTGRLLREGAVAVPGRVVGHPARAVDHVRAAVRRVDRPRRTPGGSARSRRGGLRLAPVAPAEVLAAVRQGGRDNPLLGIGTGAGSEPPEPTVGELVDAVGTWLHTAEPRVAASLVVLGYSARLVGPTLAVMLRDGVLLDVRPARVRHSYAPDRGFRLTLP